MAKCKCCKNKSFMLETDVNGLCSECAPYFYLSLADDVDDLEKSMNALIRINNPLAAAGRIETARHCVNRLRPYVEVNLARLSRPLIEFEKLLDDMEKQLKEDFPGEDLI